MKKKLTFLWGISIIVLFAISYGIWKYIVYDTERKGINVINYDDWIFEFKQSGNPIDFDLDNGIDEGIVHIWEHDTYDTNREWTNVITYDNSINKRIDLNWNEFEYSKIIISDWENKIIMMDRNLWASETTSEWRKWDYDGCYFQWWNNNCFTWKSEYISEEGYSRIDVLHETPEHYTKSNAYTTNPIKWRNEYSHKWYFWKQFVVGVRDYWKGDKHYDELWWWENDNEGNNWWWDIRKNTQKNRQGPCPEWWHVPSAGEWWKVTEIYLKDNWRDINWLAKVLDVRLSSDFADYLLLPNASNLNYDNMYNPGWYNAWMWTSSPYLEDKNSARVMYVYPTQYIESDAVWSRWYWFPIRCFENYN